MPADFADAIARASVTISQDTDRSHAGQPYTADQHRIHKRKNHNLENTGFTKAKNSRTRANDEESKQTSTWSESARHALASGQTPVFVPSKPFDEWVRFRGQDGMPVVLTEMVAGRLRRVCFLPSLFPPYRRANRAG
jgi:hypothetical protein